jgi:CheY-like chemotaxis protein
MALCFFLKIGNEKVMYRKRKNILIVEDHDCIRTLLGFILTKEYNVVAQENGLKGLQYLGSGHIPDLILLDMSMPEYDGLSFLNQLKKSGFFRDIPVLVISGNADEESIKSCINLGARAYFQKPFNPIQLKEKIHNMLAA